MSTITAFGRKVKPFWKSVELYEALEYGAYYDFVKVNIITPFNYE